MELRHKLIKILIALAVVFFLGYQYYVSVYAAIATEIATRFDHTEGIEAIGTFIRDEVAVTYDGKGTLHYVLQNGEKVAKNGTIASVFESDAASAAATRINEIDEQLTVISEMEGYNNSTAVDVTTINNRIQKHLNGFVYAAQDGRFEDVDENVSNLLTMMTRKQVATGEQNDFGALKKSLLEEKNSLTKKMGQPKGTITSENAGYFVTNADGFESMFDVQNLGKYTQEYLKETKATSVSDQIIGKIVFDYEWYLAVPTTLSESKYYKIDEKVTIKTDITSSPRLTATLHSVNLSKEGDGVVMIFRCNEMNSELASMRNGAVTVIKDEYTGIKVSNKALRHVDGVTGVFVVSGIEAKFVKTEIVYSTEEYAICKLNTGDGTKLRIYDEIIVKGRNLYDGKIIY